MLITILIFVGVLAFIILVHEIGHFMTARKFGVTVEEFGIGFPPRAKKLFKDKKGTWYTLNWLPVGGFVKMKGEQGESSSETDSFAGKPIFQRFIILFAGVAMNVVLAVVTLSIAFMIGVPQVIDDTTPQYAQVSNQSVQIVDIEEGSPAEESGLQGGDTITMLAGTAITSTDTIQDQTRINEGNEIQIVVERDDQEVALSVTPKRLEPTDEHAAMGIYTVDVGDVSYSFFYAIWEGIRSSVIFLGLILTTLWTLIVTIFSAQPVPADLVGPVGIAIITDKIVALGFAYVLQFMAIISLNLAIINILPIPALDGGRILFLLIEKLRGKPLDQRVEGMIHNIGFIVLLILVGIITIRDIINIDTIRNLF